MFKKLFAWVLCVVLLLSVAAGCAKKDPAVEQQTETTTVAVSTEEVSVKAVGDEQYVEEYDKVAYAVANNGFENGLGGWSQEKKTVPVKAVDDKKAGEASLAIDNVDEGDCHIWQSLNFTPKEGNPEIGDRVMASFWIKMSDSVKSDQGKMLLFKVEGYSAKDGKKVLASVILDGGEKKGEWILVETPVGYMVPEGSETLTIAFENDLPGKVYLDEVNIFKVVPKGEGTVSKVEENIYEMNSGFEQGLEPWGTYVDKAEAVAVVDTEKKTGEKSVLMNNKQEGSFTAIWQTLNITAEKNTPSAGDSVKVSAWIKLGDDVKAMDDKKCYFKLEHFSEKNGKALMADATITGNEEKGKWFLVEMPVAGPIPEGEETITIAFENGLPGQIFVDDVQIIKE